jgi:hypothetical protein
MDVPVNRLEVYEQIKKEQQPEEELDENKDQA